MGEGGSTKREEVGRVSVIRVGSKDTYIEGFGGSLNSKRSNPTVVTATSQNQIP